MCAGVAPGMSMGHSYLLKRVTGVSFLQFWRDRDPLVVHLPVKGTPHGVPRLRLVVEVIVVDHVDHRAHDGLAVPSDAVWSGQETPLVEAGAAFPFCSLLNVSLQEVSEHLSPRTHRGEGRVWAFGKGDQGSHFRLAPHNSVLRLSHN